MIEKIYFDASNPSNSMLALEGFKDAVFRELSNRYIESKEIKISDTWRHSEDYNHLPMILKNVVVNIFYKKNPRIKSFNSKGTIIEYSANRKMPLIVNMTYKPKPGKIIHDPTPQLFCMYYNSVYKYVEGFNLRYLTVSELKRLIKLHIRFPNMEQYFFYHSVLKPTSIARAIGVKVKDWRKNIRMGQPPLITRLVTKETNKTMSVLAPYKRYPKSFKKSNHLYSGRGKIANLLLAYRKYTLTQASFQTVPVQIFYSGQDITR